MNYCHQLLFISIAVVVTIIMIEPRRLIQKLTSSYSPHQQTRNLFFGMKYVGGIIFVVRWLFMGVMSIQKYAVHTFQHQIMKMSVF